jgi:hypothetical protein
MFALSFWKLGLAFLCSLAVITLVCILGLSVLDALGGFTQVDSAPTARLSAASSSLIGTKISLYSWMLAGSVLNSALIVLLVQSLRVLDRHLTLHSLTLRQRRFFQAAAHQQTVSVMDACGLSIQRIYQTSAGPCLISPLLR